MELEPIAEDDALGRVLPLRPDEPAVVLDEPRMEELAAAGDEPDRPYEVEDFVRRPVPVIAVSDETPLIDYATGDLVASRLAPENPAPAHLEERWDEWDGSKRTGLHAPVAILAISILLMCWSVTAYSPSFHGVLPAFRYVSVELVLHISLMLLTAWGAAHVMEMSFGRVLPGCLKLSAIAVAPMGVICLMVFLAGLTGHVLDDAFLDPLRHGSLIVTVTGPIWLITFYAAFYALFDLPHDMETWTFILIAWVIQFMFVGFAAHLILHPPPVTPPYVPPTNPFRFSFGN